MTRIIKIWVVGLILTILFFSFAARGCSIRRANSNKTSSGSSVPAWAGINAPSNLTATVSSPTQINLSWQDNSNNEDGFEIQRTTNPATGYLPLTTVGAGTVSYSDTNNLTNGLNYYYRICAYNTVGDRSAWSNEANVTINYPITISAISAGSNHTLVLANNGLVWAWGDNWYGQLGVGDFNNRLMPNLITSDFNNGLFDNINSIAAGASYSISRRNNGTLWSWGVNSVGQLGLGDILDTFGPLQIGAETDWSKITVGDAHAIALKNNRTLWAWGGSTGLGIGDTIDRWTPSAVGTNSDWAVINAGGLAYTLAIKTNGNLWGWGRNEQGQLGLGESGIDKFRYTPSQVGSESDWSIVDAAGFFYTVALKTTGTIWSWGINQYGQLGLGNSGVNTNRIIPTPIGFESDWSMIDAGYFHTVALKTNGTLWSWGKNDCGQLGLGFAEGTRTTPCQVGTDSNWFSVSGGNDHTIALKAGRTLWSWGYNASGQLGLGDNINKNSPTQVILGIPYSPSSLNADIGSPSQINISWTDNSFNEQGFKIERKLGRAGTYEQIATVGTNIVSYSDIISVAPATYYYYRVRAYNTFGNSPYSNEAGTAISGNWAGFAAGDAHTLTRKTNGTLWSWGYNYEGQLGLGDIIEHYTPGLIGTDSDWTEIDAGNYHSLARKTNGTVWSWGYNGEGELGLGISEDRNTPSQVGTQTDWSIFSAGSYHTLALKTNKTIWAWGDNTYGQLGDGTTTERTTPRQIGTASDWSKIVSGCTYSHTFAIKTNGVFWAWGWNNKGQLGVGDTINRTTPSLVGTSSDWSMISGGDRYTIALKTNSTLWSWGWNNYGQLGLGFTGGTRKTPTAMGTETDWSVVIAGYNYSIALKINPAGGGTIWSWGANDAVQLGLGDTIDRNTPSLLGTDSDWNKIVAGGWHALALKTNNTLWAWGGNSYGQLGLGDIIDRGIPTLVGE